MIDRSHLDRQTLGDPALAAEVLRLFVDQVAPLSRMVTDGPASERGRALHTMRGAALGIGASALAAECAMLDDAEAGAGTARFETVLQETVAEIEAMLAGGIATATRAK